jgi:hypothetical protein
MVKANQAGSDYSRIWVAMKPLAALQIDVAARSLNFRSSGRSWAMRRSQQAWGRTKKSVYLKGAESCLSYANTEAVS